MKPTLQVWTVPHPPKTRKTTWMRCAWAFFDNLVEFCKATSLHGLKYITEERRHWFERILWTVTCALGLAAAAILINTVWTKYSTSPTITSVESTHYPIWNIPFPAVTICNVNKVHLSAARETYTTEFSNLLNEKEYWAFVSQMAEIIQPEGVDMLTVNLEKIHSVLKNRSLDMESLMIKLTQPCESLFVKCKWRGEVTPCDQLFSMSKTDAGFCCSFNYKPPGSTKRTEPHRVNGASYLSGLSMLMNPGLEDYYAALFSFYGLQVLVHSPNEYPEISARGILLAPRKEAFLQVSAASTYSTAEVRALNREQRLCVFEDEKVLDGEATFMEDYSYSNCLVQCRATHMMQLCNCTPYFFPTAGLTTDMVLAFRADGVDEFAVETFLSDCAFRGCVPSLLGLFVALPRHCEFLHGSDFKLCSLTDVECLANHRRVFNNLHSPDPVPGLDDNENAMRCDCHPTCTDVSYSTEMSESNFFKSEYDQTNFFKEIQITNHSILHVYFKDLSILRFRRDTIYTWNDLLASFGGIVGLCLGSSLLSFVELFYHLTVRPACSILRHEDVEPYYAKNIKVYPLPERKPVTKMSTVCGPQLQWLP